MRSEWCCEGPLMPIPLPNLDDRTFEQLMTQARGLIPGLQPEWTNHNESDPGIVLVELLAWLTEMLLYRVNQIPQANVEKFLGLLNEPDWSRRRPTPTWSRRPARRCSAAPALSRRHRRGLRGLGRAGRSIAFDELAASCDATSPSMIPSSCGRSRRRT